MSNFDTIAVIGMGNVGSLVATLLQDAGLNVTGIDNRPLRREHPFAIENRNVADLSVDDLGPYDAVVSCLPYHLNRSLAEATHAAGRHYFDLTEDVPTTKRIQHLAETSQAAMAPQCGLAPGFIGIVGASLAAKFDRVRSIKLRVGALPQHPTGLLGYAFNWSPEGVVNEYLNDCEVIEDGKLKTVSPMEWLETTYIAGTKLEAFTTSGGLGTMCETFLGTVENLDYKTLRYPGHAAQMNFFFHELLMRENRYEAGRILTNAKPPVDDDVVHVHASVEGEIDGRLQRHEFVRSYEPIMIGGERRTAIAWTTASSVAAVIEMARDGSLPSQGFIKQELIPLPAFSDTKNGQRFAA
jgi:saccharopine dehydrogenase (NAD+, L-lysine-forming)